MTESSELRCKSCGADLPYEDGKKTIKCPFCGSTAILEQPQKTVEVGVERDEWGDKFPETKGPLIPRSCLVMLLIIVVFAVFICVIVFSEGWLPTYKKMTWDGNSTFVCEDNSKITMQNKKANVKNGPAVWVRNNCNFTCENCDLKGTTAIEVFGNGNVVCTNCKLQGDQVGVTVNGTGKFTIVGGSISGSKSGVKISASLFDASSITISGDVGINARESASSDIKLKDVKIDANSLALDLGAAAKLFAINTTAKAAKGVRASDSAKVTWQGGSIEATTAAEQHDGAKLEFKDNPKITGSIKAQYKDHIEGLK